MGGDERGRRSGGVQPVPHRQRVGNVVMGGTCLARPTGGAHRRIGVEEDLERGVREDHRSDVPTLDDSAAAMAMNPQLLGLDHALAQVTVGRNGRDGLGHRLGANRRRHVSSVEGGQASILVDPPAGHFTDHGGGIGRVYTGAEHGEGGGPVERSCIEMGHTQLLGHGPAHGGLAYPTGTVHGDDDRRGQSPTSISKKPGQVLETTEGSRMTTPGTTSPTNAIDIAILWSS